MKPNLTFFSPFIDLAFGILANVLRSQRFSSRNLYRFRIYILVYDLVKTIHGGQSV